MKTHLKGKKFDLAQLGKAIVDSVTTTNSSKGKKKKPNARRTAQRRSRSKSLR